ncbi:MAG: mechanosensitive ion channel [Desulfobacterales bacterium]|nr:mechanosensitive ion channel [Desulfobacterales bacterium]
MDDVMFRIQGLLTEFGLKILIALAIFIIGRWVAKGIRKIVRKLLSKGNADETIVKFAGNITYVILMIFVILAAVSKLGVQTTSLIAVLGAAGLAVGLALQGSLSNFASGILMIAFRPFKAGDYIEGAGTGGVVDEIGIFATIIKTPDNKKVIIPNSNLTSDTITNFTAMGTRRIDLVVGVSYSDDIDKVKRTLQDILKAESRLLADPAPKIGLVEMADSSVNFVVRPWVKSDDYWDTFFDLQETIKKRFDKEGISIPFPQRDVHMYQHP